MYSLSPLSFSDIFARHGKCFVVQVELLKKAWWNTNSKKQSHFFLNSNYILCLAKHCTLRSRKSQLYQQTFKSSYPRSILRCQISEKRFSHFMCGLTLSPPAVRPQMGSKRRLWHRNISLGAGTLTRMPRVVEGAGINVGWCIRPLVVQTLDSAIHRVKSLWKLNAIGFPNTYPLDSDLSGG